MVTHKRIKAYMASLTLLDSSSSSDHNIIHVAAVDFFHEQLTAKPVSETFSLSNVIPSLVTKANNDFLLKLSYLEEVKQVVAIS